MDRKVLLRTEDLVHTYKTGVTALKKVNLSIYENEVVSIVGQNGSGKTTLVRHFNGLLRPTSGKVLINEEETEKMSVGKMSQRVGYVFQNPNHQIFCTTVRAELEVAPKNFGFSDEETKKAIDDVVELMGIEGELDKHPLSLDYTTKKIITIASVLVFNPEILIMDEPTGGLDEVGRRMLTKIINMMHDKGHTVIMISHDMDYVAENSQRIVVMSQGQIIGDGVREDIFMQEDMLAQAQIEPPQIAKLDMAINPDTKVSLSVDDFVAKYK